MADCGNLSLYVHVCDIKIIDKQKLDQLEWMKSEKKYYGCGNEKNPKHI